VTNLAALLESTLQLPQQGPNFGGLPGHRIAIASIFEIHILISGLVSGFTQFGPIAEWLGWMRRRPSYDRLAHGMGRFLVYYFGFGAATATLLITILLPALWGHFWSILSRLLFWPFFVEAWTFVLMVITTYLWYYTWGSLKGPFKALHMALGGTLALASFLQVAMIDIIGSYLLTPASQTASPLALFLNPTSYPLQIHRTIANLAYAGYGIAGFAAFKYLRAKATDQRAFWDWAGSLGVIWGVAMTLLQPVVGYDYAKEVQLHAYGSWYRMMRGDLGPAFLVQIFLLGLMLLLPAWYFWRRVRTANGRGSTLLLGLVWLLALTTAFAALPYQLAITYDQVQATGMDRPFWAGGAINPFGAMIPYKVSALIAYTLLAVTAIVWYLRHMPGIDWGHAGRVEQRLLMIVAVITMGMIVLMGFIREDSRVPDLIAGQLQVQGQRLVPPPSPAAVLTVHIAQSPETVGRFDPAIATVPAGQRVTWVNDSGSYHTVTFTSGGVTSSQGFGPGQTFAVTFDRPGTYRYTCLYHPGMTGEVVVGYSAASAARTG
jgi:cytochrome d ubiquinol oxidase subunit I